MSSLSLGVVPSALAVLVVISNVGDSLTEYNLKVERGVINKGDDVEIVGLGAIFKTTLTGIGVFSCFLMVILHLF